MFVHARDATQCGCKSLIIKANDTDAVVIAVSILPSLQQLGLQNLWIAFGQWAKAWWIRIHEVLSAIGPEEACTSMPLLVVVSAFHGKGKKSVWLTWDVFEEVSETFTRLSNCPTEVSDADLQKLETFVVLMYDRSSSSTGVVDARLDLFARKPGSFGAKQLSLTQRPAVQPRWDGLRQERSGRYVGQLFSLCENCQELTKYSCKKDCNRRCKCFHTGLTCTALCSCVCEHWALIQEH